MVLLFISGLAIGFFGASMIMRNNVRRFVEKGPAHMNERIVRYALRDMDITGDQRAAIEAIVEETTPELNRISTEFGDTLETIATDQFDRIKALLDDDQVRVLEDRMQRIRERMRHRRDGRPGRRPGARRGRHQDPPPPPSPGG